MKRFYYALGLCAALLILEAWVFLPVSQAKTDVVMALLQVPAPPPPNPLVAKRNGRTRSPEFFNLSKPPPDDAPIEDLIDYWTPVRHQQRSLAYAPEPSERTLERLFKEIDKDPAKLKTLLGSFPDGEKTAEFVKGVYDHEGTTGVFSKEERQTIKEWLTYHSPYFSDELYRLAQKAGDTESYISGQEELLALATVDFVKARPIIDRLESNGADKPSRVLAKWALYRNALRTDSLGDIERYRDELKAAVEDRSLSAPMRDLAMDALVSEKEWSGRDEWYVSLLSDETLGDLGTYTGLTTLINVSPDEKYTDRMLDLLKSDNKAVRTAAIRNLLLKGNSSKPEVLRAMLPWLSDPNWANDVSNAREGIVQALSSVKMPESVPGLIKILNEKKKQPVYAANVSNSMANTAMASNRMSMAANVALPVATPAVPPRNDGRTNANTSTVIGTTEVFALRSSAIGALAFQADPSAGPALRRLMSEMEGYERYSLVEALIKCKGFSIGEQVDAFERAARRQSSSEEQANLAANAAANAVNNYSEAVSDNAPMYKPGPLNAAEIRQLIGDRMLTTTEVDDDVVYAVTTRIESLYQRDAKVAETMRSTVLRWPNVSVNLLFLHDVRYDRADADSVVRLLAMRRQIKSSFPSEIFDARAGSPTANGLMSCMLEDPADHDAILASQDLEAKAALLACSRLVRAQLPVAVVAEFVKSTDRRVALAAERYLESEDSPAARAIVLGLHPGEAKLTGATTGFFINDADGSEGGSYRPLLFASVDPNASQEELDARTVIYDEGEGEHEGEMGPVPETEDLTKTEKMLQDEVKKDAELLGVYAYARQYVRIYKDRVVFSWDDDDSRYRERPLTSEEFDLIKNYLASNRVDELTPFLACDVDPCVERELVMLGRGGGRRVYTDGGTYDFFTGLDKIFAEFKIGNAVLKYALSREIPNLEILLADDNLDVQAVWKEGNDLRVAATDKQARERVDEEIDAAVEKAAEKDDEIPEGAEILPSQALRLALTKKREFEGIGWHSVVNGHDAGIVAQPAGFEFVPARDQRSVPATQEQWKARAGTIEIRASEEGVFKFSGGRPALIAKGAYSDPVITPNGKWVVLHRTPTGDEADSTLVRINLLTGREYQVKLENYREFVPKAYIATINKVLVVENGGPYYEGRLVGAYGADTGVVSSDPDAASMMLLDPDTGMLQEIAGEMGPLAQQTYRPLQKTGRPNEFWAAITVEGSITKVGIFNTNNFGFKQLMSIPKMWFNSMSMWVDEPGGKIYFTYRGHLLCLPLKK